METIVIRETVPTVKKPALSNSMQPIPGSSIPRVAKKQDLIPTS